MFLPSRHLILVLILSLCIYHLYCLESLPACSPYLISSNGLTTLTDDPSATHLNPVAGEGGVSTSTSFLYGMTRLNQVELASIVNYQYNSMYAAWQAMDDEDYTRQDIRFGIRYSQPTFRVGLGYKILYDDIPGYGSEKDDRFSAGFRFKLKNTTLDIGSEHSLPITRDEPFKAGDFNFTLNQQIEQNLALAIGLNVSDEEIYAAKLGCSFYVTSSLKAVASWESEPGRFGVGCIFSVKWLNLAYALQTHPELDWTQVIYY